MGRESMTKKEIAKAFINLFAAAENDKIAFGYEPDEAVLEVCKDCDIRVEDYLLICDYLSEE